MSSTVIQLALCIAGIVLPIIALRRGLFRFPSADAPAPFIRSVSAAGEIGAPYFFSALLIIYFTQVVIGALVIAALLALTITNGNSNTAPASPSLQQLTFDQQAILAACTYTVAIIAAFFALKVLRKQAATPRHPLLDASAISPALRADNAGLSFLRGPAPVLPSVTTPRASRPIRSTLVQSTIAFVIIFPVCILVSTLTTYIASLIDGIPPDPIAHDTLRLLLDHLAPAPGSPPPPLSTTDGLAIAAIILGAAIGAPILEEFIFRVFAQSALLTFTRRRWLSILLTSLFFLLLHIGSATFADNPSKVENPSGVAWYALPSLFILSLGLGLAYERTGRIAVPILIHAAFNSVNLAVALLIAGHTTGTPARVVPTSTELVNSNDDMSFITLPSFPLQPPAFVAAIGPYTWIAWSVAGLSLAIMLWMLIQFLRSRSARAVRHCPTCLYDMRGVCGLKCPECGREHATEQSLFSQRPSRRWKAMFAALLSSALLLSATAIAVTPRPTWGGWPACVPTQVLLFAATIADTKDELITEEVILRFQERNMQAISSGTDFKISDAEAMFLNRLLGREIAAVEKADFSREAFKQSASLCATLSISSNRLAQLREILEGAGRDTTRLFVRLHTHPNPAVRMRAMAECENPRDPRWAPYFHAALSSSDIEEFWFALEFVDIRNLTAAEEQVLIAASERHRIDVLELHRLGKAGTKKAAEYLTHPDKAAAAAKYFIAYRSDDPAHLESVFHTAQNCPNPEGRNWCVYAMMWLAGADPKAQSICCRLATDDPAEQVRSSAFNALVQSATMPPQLIVSTLTAGLADPSPTLRFACCGWLAARGQDALPALPTLQVLADDPTQDALVRKRAEYAIRTLTSTPTSPDADSSDPSIPATPHRDP